MYHHQQLQCLKRWLKVSTAQYIASMKLSTTINHLNDILPYYTQLLEVIRDSSIWYKVLKRNTLELNMPDHPVIKSVLYNDLVVNFKGTIIIAIMDLSIIIKNLTQAKNKWEKAYHLRQGSLLIYEFINIYNKQNKIIYPILKSKFPDICELYMQQSLKLREFKKIYKYDSEMAQLRNNTIAHINDNIFEYCLIISKIKPTILRKCMLEFLQFLTEIEKMQEEIEIKLVNEVLALTGNNLDGYIKDNQHLPKLKKLKFPKMLK